MPYFQTIADVQTAVLAAQQQYLIGTNQPGDVAVNLNATDTVMYNNSGQRDDFGLPALWSFAGDQDALRDWWIGLHTNSGNFLTRQWKPDLQRYQVNLQYSTTTRPLFNFHLTVP